MNCDIIKLLPDSVANQIAAGEVIQRPASVVKELVENAVDAGATAIEIIIKDGGRTLIQVVDNGKGMSPTDARMAFERHATSKITSAQDLYSLHTMGFRGEALPSIAAVSQIDLRTMQPDQAGGTRLQLSESKFVSQEPCACRPGTNIMVKNLFFNLPARRKFLKSDKVEKGAIIQEFTRLALVNTAVDFTFVYDGKTEKQLVHGSLKQRIIDLIGKSVGSNLLPIATETELARIDGFVGTPESAIKTKPHQFFFVNGRNMRHPYFAKAVTSCYEEIIRSENQPNFFINISVDPAAIDVNVHPQKHEIKFAQEQAIWQMINAAVRQALGRVNAAGAIDFDPDAITDIPTFAPDVNVEMPSISTDDSYDPFKDFSGGAASTAHSRSSYTPQHFTNPVPQDWDKLYESFATRRDAPTMAPATPDLEGIPTSTDTPAQPALLQTAESHTHFFTVNRRYIAIPSSQGILLIDRHRAHIRVLYDRFINSLTSKPVASQKLIFPESITLSPAQSTVLSAMGDIPAQLGFDISFLGGSTWAVNAVPALTGNAISMLTKMVENLSESGELNTTDLFKPAALALARSAAILPGQDLSDDDTDALIAEILASPEGKYTPDGRPIFVTVANDYISKLFS